MTFFLRNITLTAFLIALIVGSFSVYFSARMLYEGMLNQVVSERIRIVNLVGTTLLEGESPAETATSTPGVSATARGETLQSALNRVGLNQPGVFFTDVIDISTRAILASVDQDRVGTVVSEELPSYERGEVLLELRVRGERPTVELTYLGSSGRLLWMSLNQSFFVNPAIASGVVQGVLLLVAFCLFGIIFFLVVRKFFMEPVRKLKWVLIATSDAKEAKEIKKEDVGIGQESFGELLESFRDVADRIESTIEHDKVISQSKSDFISTTAHQLRTPLSGINWVLESMLSEGENLTAEQKSLINRSLEKTKELVDIVGELLNAAGIEQGKFGFHREELSLKDEIERTIAEEKETASKNNITLQFEHAEEAFPSVYADKERIRWVIRNLIENAIRYGKDGGTVTVTLTGDRKRLTVSVKDNGIGISPSAQEHIFERFFRSPEGKAKRSDGSGLGLYIVKNIINYHGGRIWFKSVEGVGTTFFFTLPTAREHASTLKE